mmetsp:Transcript_51977/g.86449  ORF Transcript_51977/g.86449 Transcript_51977/m.86449 type:complete len:1050 (+) Transcript_51977:168-3317(+)
MHICTPRFVSLSATPASKSRFSERHCASSSVCSLSSDSAISSQKHIGIRTTWLGERIRRWHSSRPSFQATVYAESQSKSRKSNVASPELSENTELSRTSNVSSATDDDIDDYILDLDEIQQSAIEVKEGPVLLKGAPGTGKTRVLASRIWHLVNQQGVDPSHIAVFCTNERAKRDFSARLKVLLGEENAKAVTVGTYESIGLRIIQEHALLLGYQPNMSIYDTDAQLRILRMAMKELRIDSERNPPFLLLDAIRNGKSLLMTPNRFSSAVHDAPKKAGLAWLNIPQRSTIANLYARYQKDLSLSNAIDLADIPMLCCTLFSRKHDLAAEYRNRWQHIFADQLEDISIGQYEMLRHLSVPMVGGNLYVAADQDTRVQYWPPSPEGFTALDKFLEELPSIKTFHLETNFRCSQPILDAVQYMLERGRNENPEEEQLYENALSATAVREVGDRPIRFRALQEREEAAYVAREIEVLRREDVIGRYGDAAILYRHDVHARQFQSEFAALNIPCRFVANPQFYQKKEAMDLIAYLRLVHNPIDAAALERAINVPQRGIGDRSWDYIMEWANDDETKSPSVFVALAEHLENMSTSLSSRVRVPLHKFVVSVMRVRQFVLTPQDTTGRMPSLREIVEFLIDEIDYLTYINNLDDAQGKRQTIEEFLAYLDQYTEHVLPDVITPGFKPGRPSDLRLGGVLHQGLASVLAHLSMVSEWDTLDSGDVNPDETKDRADGVLIAPIYLTKGMEFAAVFMVNMEEGILPRSEVDENSTEMIRDRGRPLKNKNRALDSTRRLDFVPMVTCRLAYIGMSRATDRLYLTNSKRRRRPGTHRLSADPSRFLHFPESMFETARAQILREKMAQDRRDLEDERKRERLRNRSGSLDQIDIKSLKTSSAALNGVIAKGTRERARRGLDDDDEFLSSQLGFGVDDEGGVGSRLELEESSDGSLVSHTEDELVDDENEEELLGLNDLDDDDEESDEFQVVSRSDQVDLRRTRRPKGRRSTPFEDDETDFFEEEDDDDDESAFGSNAFDDDDQDEDADSPIPRGPRLKRRIR